MYNKENKYILILMHGDCLHISYEFQALVCVTGSTVHIMERH